jgi:hypothetical protein
MTKKSHKNDKTKKGICYRSVAKNKNVFTQVTASDTM